jgi:hypothetical protein
MADKKRRTARSATSRSSRTEPIAVQDSLIAELAYNRWIARGCPVSDGLEDWFAAQAELQSQPPARSALRRLNA